MHAEVSSLPRVGCRPARAPGWVLGGCWEDTGVRQRHRSGLCHRNNIFNTGGERGAHPALTRDSGSAVGCEHSRLGRGPMAWTRGMLLPGLPALGQTWVLPVVPGLVDYK